MKSRGRAFPAEVKIHLLKGRQGQQGDCYGIGGEKTEGDLRWFIGSWKDFGRGELGGFYIMNNKTRITF